MLKRLTRRNQQIKRTISEIIENRKFEKLMPKKRFDEFNAAIDKKVGEVDQRLYLLLESYKN